MEEGTTPISVWVLEREDDGLTKIAKDICWIEFGEDKRFKEKHSVPAIGRSLLMGPFNEFFTWQTTLVTEVVENSPETIKFKTKNSTYILRHRK
jgi:hypothetical protein